MFVKHTGGPLALSTRQFSESFALSQLTQFGEFSGKTKFCLGIKKKKTRISVSNRRLIKKSRAYHTFKYDLRNPTRNKFRGNPKILQKILNVPSTSFNKKKNVFLANNFIQFKSNITEVYKHIETS